MTEEKRREDGTFVRRADAPGCGEVELDVLRKRIDKVKDEMKRRDVEAILLSKEANKNYLSKFYSSSFDIVITQERNYLLTDFRYIEAARKLEPLYTVVQTKAGYGRNEVLGEISPQSCGVEFSSISYNGFLDVMSVLNGAGHSCEMKDISGIVEKSRIVKDESEIEKIRQAARIADDAFSYILGEIRPGVSEKEIAWLLERRMRESGASGLSFETICAAGIHSSMPHAHPTDELIRFGDFVTLDFGCVFDGYCSDMTRTVAVGSVSDEQKEIYSIVLKAQKAACEAIRPGMTGKEADAAARDVICAMGYGDYFGHSLGHGVGLEIHEAPTAGPLSSDVFEKNMLVTIEPGIYLPKRFGVRIEDLSIVGDSAIINLVASEKEMIIL